MSSPLADQQDGSSSANGNDAVTTVGYASTSGDHVGASTVVSIDLNNDHDTSDTLGNGDSFQEKAISSTPAPTLNAYLVCAAVSSVVGSAGQFGYAIGMLNNIRPVIISDFQDNTTCSVGFDANEDATPSSNNKFGLATAMMCVGGLVASLIAGRLSNKFGRRMVLLANNVVAITSGLIMGFATNYATLIVGRVFQGFAAGIGLVVVANYLGEISPTNLRGTMGAAGQVGISTAIFVATVLGLPDLLGTCKLWNVVVGGPILLAVLQLASLPFFPESPKYLYLTRNDPDAARAALRKLRGADADIETDIQAMEAEKAASAGITQLSFLQAVRNRNLRSRLLLTAVLHASQQLSGINGVFFYSTAIYSSAGLSNVAVVALVPALVNVIFTFVSFKVVDKVGRRKLMLIGLAGLLVCHLVLTAGFGFNKRYFDGVKGSNWTSVLTIAGSLGVVIFFSVGPGPIPWLLVVELFPQSSLAIGFVIAGLSNWLMNYIVGQFFLDVLLGLAPYGFLVFAGLALALLVSVYYLQPETKGLRVEEVDAFYRKKADEASGLAFCLPAGRDGSSSDM